MTQLLVPQVQWLISLSRCCWRMLNESQFAVELIQIPYWWPHTKELATSISYPALWQTKLGNVSFIESNWVLAHKVHYAKNLAYIHYLQIACPNEHFQYQLPPLYFHHQAQLFLVFQTHNNLSAVSSPSMYDWMPPNRPTTSPSEDLLNQWKLWTFHHSLSPSNLLQQSLICALILQSSFSVWDSYSNNDQDLHIQNH